MEDITMNAIEKQMVDLLIELRQNHGVTEIKASLEAEGILLNELLRTKEITMAAGVGLSVKIGGCEALTDARLAKNYGVSILMSPMIESRFALEKFLAMADAVFPAEEQADTKFFINIETLEGHRQIGQILGAENLPLLKGIVLGRTDLRSALKLPDIDGPEMLEAAKGIFRPAKEKSLRCIVGGGITEKTVPFLVALDGLIDGYETRKVVVGRYRKEPERMCEAIRLALRFELFWYQSRRQTYLELAQEDGERMKKIEGMLNHS
jgi:4-hydroxy-2-oxoheptanedioate aldolase